MTPVRPHHLVLPILCFWLLLPQPNPYAAETHQDDFTLQCQTARALRLEADRQIQSEGPDAEQLCLEALDHAARACRQHPELVDGWYEYAQTYLVYAGTVSMYTALQQGLYSETRRALTKAESINRLHDDAGVLVVAGEFWSMLPWPMDDRSRARRYFNEALSFAPRNQRAQVAYGRFLLTERKSVDRERGRRLLRMAAHGPDPDLARKATLLLAGH